MLLRLPFAQWPGRFLADGVHYTKGTTTYPSTSDPYANGGDPATHTTGLALTYNGYGLKGWLGVQKMKEIKALVIDRCRRRHAAYRDADRVAAVGCAGTPVGVDVVHDQRDVGDHQSERRHRRGLRQRQRESGEHDHLYALGHEWRRDRHLDGHGYRDRAAATTSAAGTGAEARWHAGGGHLR